MAAGVVKQVSQLLVIDFQQLYLDLILTLQSKASTAGQCSNPPLLGMPLCTCTNAGKIVHKLWTALTETAQVQSVAAQSGRSQAS